MRKAVWTCITLAVLVCTTISRTWAVERELSGVRLGDNALDLLDRPGYGQPDFIGPLGTVAVAAEQPQVRMAPGGAGALRSGPAGPSQRGGGRGMGARGGMRGGRGGGGMRGGRGRGGMRGGPRGGGQRGGMRAGGGASVGTRSRTAGAARAQGPGMYWYYKRPGNATAVLSLDPEGEVTAITLTGIAPSRGGSTSRGIGLGSGYMEIIAQYGYPDQTVSAGTALELTYVDHGVRFSLDAMRVREIAIGAHIAAAAEAAPIAPEVEPPPAGMTIEELRGYL
jgi:hypothetical protein